LFGESIDSSVDISLTLIGMLIHWPTLTIIKVLMVLQYIAISETLRIVIIFFIPILMFGCSRRNGLIEFGNDFE